MRRALLRIALLAAIAAPAAAQPSIDEPAVLVASDELRGAYARSVLWVSPWRRGIAGENPPAQHVGVLLNRPTQVTLARMFPQQEATRAVRDPVYLGGPTNARAIFAAVRTRHAPEDHESFILAPTIRLLVTDTAIDKVIEATPNDARYFAGVVLWAPGELEDELRKGWFVLRPADPELFFRRDAAALWELMRPKPGERQAARAVRIAEGR